MQCTLAVGTVRYIQKLHSDLDGAGGDRRYRAGRLNPLIRVRELGGAGLLRHIPNRASDPEYRDGGRPSYLTETRHRFVG